MSHEPILASDARDAQAPQSNRRLEFKDSEAIFSPKATFPPALIGGEENVISPMKKGSDTPVDVSVDWLTISVTADPLKSLVDEIEFVEKAIVGWPMRALHRTEKNLTGCQETWELVGVDPETGEAVPLFKVGHMSETTTGLAYVVMSIPGHCCPHFDMGKLAELGKQAKARITRVDLAADDFTGHFSVHRAKCIYAKGGFQSKGKTRGSMPKFTEIKSGRGAESHGKTFYVGDRKNGKMLRVYEKGLKDDPTRPQWVRWEVQFGNKDRELAWEMLSNPAAYFLGAYAPFEKLFAGRIQNASPKYIKTEYEAKSAQSMEKLIGHIRTQYGKTLRVAHEKAKAGGFDIEQMFAMIERTGVPRTLIMPTPEAVAHLFGDRAGRRFSEVAA